MRIALIGATGMVGTEMVKVLGERNLPVTELIPVASEQSEGRLIEFKGKSYPCITLPKALALRPDIALFSAGGSVSLEWAPKFAQMGTFVIDNSSAWRMHPDYKLIVPEINADILTEADKIIANPNCSTIQMVMALFPLHKKYGIKRLVISTYQSVSGTGYKAMEQMNFERVNDKSPEAMAYGHRIDKNCIPQCDVFVDNGYTKEEMKLVNETRKILGDDSIRITATAVRVPVDGGHSEAVNVELNSAFEMEEILDELSTMPGVEIQNDNHMGLYPMPLYAKGKDNVFVGRIRRDESQDNTLNMWVVSDNLRKGAATNAVQIAEYLYIKKLVSEKEVATNN